MNRALLVFLMILWTAAPASIFAQQQAQQPIEEQELQPVEGRLFQRMTTLFNTPVSHPAGAFQVEIRDVVFSLDGEITHLVIEAFPGVAATPGMPGTLPPETAPGTGEGADTPPAQDPQTGEPAPGTAQPGVVQPAFVSYLVPIDQVAFDGPDRVPYLDLDQDALEGLPVLPDERLPADIVEDRHMRGSWILDYQFVNPQGEELGGVDDLMLDLEQHRVSYIALATGGFLGIGVKLVEVPLGAIDAVDTTDERLVVNISQEQLDEVEGFDADNWPTQPRTW